MLLPFLREEGDVLFQRTTHVHIWLLRLNVLFVVYNCPDHPDPQISRQWNGNLLFLQSLPKLFSNWDNRRKVLETLYRSMTFGTVVTVLMREYMPVLPPEGVHCVMMWLFGNPLLWRVCHWSEFVIIYSYNDKLPVISIFNTMNLSLKVSHFDGPK